MKFSIEAMTEKLVPDVVRLEKECFSQPWSENALAASLHEPNFRFLVALKDGALAGYIGFYEICEGAFVTNIAVFPEFRRNGAGTALLKAACAGAEAGNRKFITLEVRESDAAAASLYSSLGFRKAGIRKNFYSLPVENGIIYTKYF